MTSTARLTSSYLLGYSILKPRLGVSDNFVGLINSAKVSRSAYGFKQSCISILSRSVVGHLRVRDFHTFHIAKHSNPRNRLLKFTKMTNKPMVVLREHNTNQSDACTTKPKPHTTAITGSNGNNYEARAKALEVPRQYTLAEAANFRTMAGIQRLVLEPTREHIENIRHDLRNIRAKNNDDQQITLVKDSASGIATVCIRSAAKNGISGKMMCDFLDIVDELHRWNEGKGVMIHGHGSFFCSGKHSSSTYQFFTLTHSLTYNLNYHPAISSGGDLITVREMANYEDGLKMATLMQYNLNRLQTLPMITMSFIEGRALGGGAEIAITTDLRVITKSAKLGYVHCRVGIVAAWGGGSRLVQLVGPSRAVELMSSGRLVGADEALSLGLVNQVIDDSNISLSETMDRAKDYLKSHIIGAKSTIIAIKGLVNAARTLPLEQALIVEGQILSSTWGKQPHLDALNNNVRHRDG